MLSNSFHDDDTTQHAVNDNTMLAQVTEIGFQRQLLLHRSHSIAFTETQQRGLPNMQTGYNGCLHKRLSQRA